MPSAAMNQRSRLAWRCRRGMLELDLLLQDFLDNAYEGLSKEQQQAFEQLLALPDALLYDYLLAGARVEDREFMDVVEKIRAGAVD